MGIQCDMRLVESAPKWVLNKLSSTSNAELICMVTVLWGIWCWRNKKVWKSKIVSPKPTMDWSSYVVIEQDEARQKISRSDESEQDSRTVASDLAAMIKQVHQWHRPPEGSFKVNVDLSVFTGSKSFL